MDSNHYSEDPEFKDYSKMDLIRIILDLRVRIEYLEIRDAKLTRLECKGVDKWEGYYLG